MMPAAWSCHDIVSISTVTMSPMLVLVTIVPQDSALTTETAQAGRISPAQVTRT